jgi:hypothetical protein
VSIENAQALEIIGIKKRRLHELRKQAARTGANTDPAVTMEIEDLAQEIPKLEKQAEQAISAVGLPSALMSGTSEVRVDPPAPLAHPKATQLSVPAQALGGLVDAEQPHAGFAYQGPAMVLDPPPIQVWMGRRTETVAGLAVEAGKATWFALYGNTSRGKTLLTRLLADSLGGTITWMEFAGLGQDGGSLHLEKLCASLTNRLPPLRREEWYRAACRAIGNGSVLVLDDLPNLAAMPQLCSRLVPIIRECGRAGVRVLSSSLYQLPASIRQEVGPLVVEQAAPPFTERDAEEVIKAFNAPPGVVQSAVKLISAVTRQHPTLLVAACRYLETLGWNLDGEAFQGLFRGTYSNDLAKEVHQKLQVTVPDAVAREFLCRLSIIGGAFSLDDVDALAGVPPPIIGAREKLRDVTNSWVEGRPDGQCMVSPLLANMGRDNLPGDVKRACHLALAGAIIARRVITPHLAFMAITHYHQGGDFKNAGMHLLMVLKEATAHADKLDGDALLLLWTREPLPEAMDLNIRLIIRGLHIVLFHKLKKPLAYLFGDLEQLLSQVNEKSMFGAAGAVSFVAAAAGRKHPLEAGRLLRRCLQLNAQYPQRASGRGRRKTAQDPFTLSQEAPLHVLIWVLMGEFGTAAHVNDWLDTLKALPVDARNRAMAMDTSHISSVVVAESLTGAEQAKRRENRDWPAVVTALTGFAGRAHELRCEVLWAAFIRAKVTVQGEYLRDVDGALATATEASNLASVDPIVRFLIDGTIGRQLLLAKRYQDARFWLRRALDRKADKVFAYERANVLLAASHAFGLEDAVVGLKYSDLATTASESEKEMPTIERAKAWCERGVAEYLAGGAASAFTSWERGGEYLFAMSAQPRTPFWKEMIVLYGHMSGYLARLAETGQPPTETSAGDPYTPPERGVFMTTNADRIAYFNEHTIGGLWRIIAYYAEAVGNSESARTWKARAADAGRKAAFLALVAEAEREQIPRVLREKGYKAALEAGRKSGYAMMVFRREVKAGRHGVVPEQDMPGAVAELDEAQRRTAEDLGIIAGLIPCVLSVATRAVRAETQGTVKAEAEQLVEACRDIGAGSAAPDRWALLAELVQRAYVLDHSASQMSEWRKTVPGPQSESFTVLGRLAESANATPTEAVVAMLAVMPHLCGCFPPHTAIHQELLVPFVVSYWAYKFEHQRFDFNRPAILESQLPEAFAATEEERVVAVFRALHLAFRFSGPMPEEIRHWLYG